MRTLLAFLFLIFLLSCEKEPLATPPNTFCWRCEKKTTVYYTRCNRRTMSGSTDIEFLCDITVNDALAYEKTWKGVYVVTTGSMTNIPCDYFKTTTYHTSMKCYQQGTK